ncbi:transporter [Halioglobus sp. HI00S01]|uniref:transporter n=1 Tax=Halioglobus sp. HI00S01 TaxID=1822214 RepID=UPI000826986E|nr:transporter [Halioglobus sp. HI00S01]
MRLTIATGCVVFQLLLAGYASSQALEPRSFNNIPVGETFLLVGLGRSDGDLSPSPSSPLQDAELTIDVGLVGVSHTFALAGSSSKVDFVAGRTCYEGSAIFMGEFAEGRRCDYTDPNLKLTWNFYGAPAMGLEEFGGWQQGLVVGASVAAQLPWGSYSSEQLINAGANRWKVTPALGVTWRTGRWQWELKGQVSVFEENDDFFNGNTIEQDPLYQVSGHLIRLLGKGRWVSLDANYFAGGRTDANGERQDDRQENSRLGITFSMPFTRHQSLKLYASRGVLTRIGNEFDTFGVGWVYRL